jgi:UDP-N-acetylglucosamine--N-acetylmuramyl-(pentapeptide) pyrophosphoryl-undecaprenol N-acetylglucosamine transferase
MKILLTGGGTGGHFYPLIAVAEEIRGLAREDKIVMPEMYFMATDPYNPEILFEYNIEYKKITTGKIRRNLNLSNLIKNFIDLFKIFFGIFSALYKVFMIYPDVIFGKGGYSSFPALFAGVLLRIPVIIHESDSRPGKVNSFIGKFATKVAVSYPEASKYFKQEKVAWTGNPIRREIINIKSEGARERFELEEGVPVILILGGSQGSVLINENIVDALASLVETCQILHQTGEKNYKDVSGRAKIVLEKSEFKNRYHPFPYFNEEDLQLAAGVSDLVISRAGSTIFEIAVWGKPSILIPIHAAISHDQHHNAFSYARMGAAHVIEENNLEPEIITAEVNKILKNPELQERMKNAAIHFAKRDSARVIAKAIVEIGLSHD